MTTALYGIDRASSLSSVVTSSRNDWQVRDDLKFDPDTLAKTALAAYREGGGQSLTYVMTDVLMATNVHRRINDMAIPERPPGVVADLVLPPDLLPAFTPTIAFDRRIAGWKPLLELAVQGAFEHNATRMGKLYAATVGQAIAGLASWGSKVQERIWIDPIPAATPHFTRVLRQELARCKGVDAEHVLRTWDSPT